MKLFSCCRNYQQQQAAYNVVVNQLSKSEAFIQLPPQQKQVLVAQYLALYQQQQQQRANNIPVSASNPTVTAPS